MILVLHNRWSVTYNNNTTRHVIHCSVADSVAVCVLQLLCLHAAAPVLRAWPGLPSLPLSLSHTQTATHSPLHTAKHSTGDHPSQSIHEHRSEEGRSAVCCPLLTVAVVLLLRHVSCPLSASPLLHIRSRCLPRSVAEQRRQKNRVVCLMSSSLILCCLCLCCGVGVCGCCLFSPPCAASMQAVWQADISS